MIDITLLLIGVAVVFLLTDGPTHDYIYKRFFDERAAAFIEGESIAEGLSSDIVANTPGPFAPSLVVDNYAPSKHHESQIKTDPVAPHIYLDGKKQPNPSPCQIGVDTESFVLATIRHKGYKTEHIQAAPNDGPL